MNKQGIINRDVNAATRAAMALQLRAQRLTFDAIAKQCGYASPGACRNAIQRELERNVVKRDVDYFRTEELAMLDQLHAAVWPLAVPLDDAVDEKGKKAKVSLFAVDRVIAIAERRAKLLGLDMRPDEQVVQQNYIKKIILVSDNTLFEVQA